jgi:hypothetical protein
MQAIFVSVPSMLMCRAVDNGADKLKVLEFEPGAGAAATGRACQKTQVIMICTKGTL